MGLRSFVHGVDLYVNRNKMVGHFRDIKALEHRVNIYDYHPELTDYGSNARANNSRWNLGDSLGFVITEWMLQKEGLHIDTPVSKKKFFNTVGSNIFRSYQNTTIWGSGVLYEPQSKWKYLSYYPFRKLDVRAVRGPLSRQVILKFGHKCPSIYGDPAILLPYIYMPQIIEHKEDVCVIPQFIAEKRLREAHPGINMLSMNTNDYKYVIDRIVSSKLVITSSLHGIILAESYNVPAVFFRSLSKTEDFKYLDYYYSTGRTEIKVAESIEEALQMEPQPIPDLSSMQTDLMNSFPYDLWME